MLSFFPGIFLVGVYWLVLLLLSMEPGADESGGYAGLMLFLLLLTIPSELVALGLGVAGVFQRTRKRSFALLGVACSVLFLALIETQVRFADVASFIVGMTEPQPVTHSPGNK